MSSRFEKSFKVTVDLAGEFYPENANKRIGSKAHYILDQAITTLTIGIITKGLDIPEPHISLAADKLTFYRVYNQTTNSLALDPNHITIHVGILRAFGNALTQGGDLNAGTLLNTYATYLEIQTPEHTFKYRVSSLRLYLAIARGAMADWGWQVIDDLKLFPKAQNYSLENYRDFEQFLNDPEKGFTAYTQAADYPDVINYDGSQILPN
ncbi:hypothetical protein [Periweissella ghanensis]|uniref:Uncharacterized protein n=1 Tax=Periweissella ghanensis TaxID=467997 RepID=A0ABN8BP41_9LACO|nr:hypothetical protein [Periweissella ghanensis]MCM0601694.1 hypothetical protein [Periweissella ghanensis]CAH0418381.1 hypothetical protein WGH24286_00799 [Periweissella ghanensis]